jgi:hypothetical protein
MAEAFESRLCFIFGIVSDNKFVTFTRKKRYLLKQKTINYVIFYVSMPRGGCT